MTDFLENHTFDEIAIGDQAGMTRALTREDIELFAVVSGDLNPAHLDLEYAVGTRFGEVIAHGMWGGALISAVLGTQYPGPGSIYLGQTLQFRAPVRVGDVLSVTVQVTAKDLERKRVTLACECVNQEGKPVIIGTAEVLAPTVKIRRPAPELPRLRLMRQKARYGELMDAVAGRPPIRVAVVHPCDQDSLQGAIEAARAGVIVPLLVGPRAKITAVAESAGIDLTDFTVVDAPHSHAAADQATRLARAGQIDAIMKGSLHTDELMHAVLAADSGLRTGRRVSHVFVMDVPAYPRPLFITDAAINIAPSLYEKRDIVQNAIELAHALGVAKPKVAVLSAVETVNDRLQSTLDAAALCKMADRGQISGGVLDGPLAFDNAISAAAAATKGIVSPVAGQADILLVPDLESGNMLAKQLQYLADAQAAGIVLGASLPIILTSRADGALARTASCAVASLLLRHRPPQAAKPEADVALA